MIKYCVFKHYASGHYFILAELNGICPDYEDDVVLLDKFKTYSVAFLFITFQLRSERKYSQASTLLEEGTDTKKDLLFNSKRAALSYFANSIFLSKRSLSTLKQ